ncbi:MAG: RNA polymerase sigma factor [Anderseniella sp.]
MLPPLTLQRTIDRTVREEWGRILACLVKAVGDLQLAEDCLQDAVVSAMNHWQKNGLPNSPAAWLITAARRKAIDRLRKDRNFACRQDEISYLIELDNQALEDGEPELIPDKRLEMIFTCCHPALAEKTRVALTLRTLGGLTTEEIAHAFLDRPDAMAQRLVRAKKKISLAGIPYKIPDSTVLPERIASVLSVIYLIFNEGYSASSGDALTRTDLIEEAIRLARIVNRLIPDNTEVSGLLALLLLHDARRFARTGKLGELIPLDMQNRRRWDQAKIAEGVGILETVLPKRRLGAYQLQAAISAVHAQSPSWQETDWPQIEALYNLLYAVQPSPVVRINQAVAVSYARSLEAALAMLDEAATGGVLDAYQPYFAARADILARAGRTQDAKKNFGTAIDLSDNSQEKAFLHDKISHL